MRVSKPHDVEALLKAIPKTLEAVVLHGADQGLVRERSVAFETAILGDDPNPFQRISLGDGDLRGNPGRLLEEAEAVTMLGGAKFIRVRCSTDVASAALALYLKERDGGLPPIEGLMCFEAGELRAAQALRKTAEADKRTVGILCGHDNQASLEDFLRTRIKTAKMDIEPAALALLLERLTGDRGIAAREMEKLETYMLTPSIAEPVTITAGDITAVIADPVGADLDLALEAAFSGNPAKLENELDRLRARGTDAGRLLRAGLSFVDRLSRKLAGQKVPMSYAQDQLLARIAGRWTPPLAARARSILIQALVQGAKADAPSQEIGERALLSIAQAARR